MAKANYSRPNLPRCGEKKNFLDIPQSKYKVIVLLKNRRNIFATRIKSYIQMCWSSNIFPKKAAGKK